MTTDTPLLENPLTAAIDQLRDICSAEQPSASAFDTASVRRIIAHITNINRSVVQSTQDHVNAAKRLNDFATSFERLARNSQPPNEELTAHMAAIANRLRAASAELASRDVVPDWRAP